jgi:uncharacterized membrane protein YqjE
MAEPEPAQHGVVESLRRLCDTGLALLQNRAELFAVEIQEQKTRLVRILLLAAAAMFAANMAAIVVTVTIIVLAGERGRVPALIGLCVFYLLATAAAFLALRRELRSAPPPLSGTIGELKKDRECVNSHN